MADVPPRVVGPQAMGVANRFVGSSPRIADDVSAQVANRLEEESAGERRFEVVHPNVLPAANESVPKDSQYRRMRAIVQRVSAATVAVDGREVGRCGYGLMLLVGVHVDDTEAEVKRLAEKVTQLRIFSDPAGKMNLSLLDFPSPEGAGTRYEYEILAVSNFTVYGDTKKNRRPSFVASAGFDRGQELFDRFVHHLRSSGIGVQTGIFGANMQVSLINDGPVTVILDVDRQAS